MSNSKIYSSSVRKRLAYYTAFRVFFSYYWLQWKAKFFGKKYHEKRIKELHLLNAERVKNRVQQLQGLFIKFGQVVSNLSNILPEEFRVPLEELQDHIPAKPFPEIQTTVLQELGKPIIELFTEFEEIPIASASIGQVHKARYNGELVAVKVQHQNIQEIAKADLEILKNLIRIHEFFMEMHGLEHTYEQVKTMIEEELDYTKEANSMSEIAKNLEEVPPLKVKVPKVSKTLSTRKVLVSEFCEGVKIGNITKLQSWKIDSQDLAKRLIELYCKMVLVDGFYHADPHPGNILVNESGEIILLDFGAVAKLKESTKTAIPELIEALVKNDTEETVIALRKLGFLGSNKASRKFVEKLVDIFKDFLENEVELDGLNFQNMKLNAGITSITSLLLKIDLRDVSNNIRIPKEYILLNRTVVLLMGNTYLLAPELNALDIVRPYMKQQVLDKDAGYTDMLIRSFKGQITTALSLPNELSQFLKNSKESELEEDVKAIRSQLHGIYFLGKQFFYLALLVIMLVWRFIYMDPTNHLFQIINSLGIVVSLICLTYNFYKDLKSKNDNL